MIDVACRSRWARAARGVVALIIEGAVCSGSLLNSLPRPHTRPDARPHTAAPNTLPDTAAPGATSPADAHASAPPPALLLTAYHCVRPLIERWEAEAREARGVAGDGAGEVAGAATGEAAAAAEEERAEAETAEEEVAGRFAPISVLFNWQAS